MATKLNEQEIEAIKGFQQKTQNVIMDLGKIELQLSDLEFSDDSQPLWLCVCQVSS